MLLSAAAVFVCYQAVVFLLLFIPYSNKLYILLESDFIVLL